MAKSWVGMSVIQVVFFSFKHGCTPNSLINVSLFENTEAILRIKEKKNSLY